jgi:AcrR family transcriptional regulator
MAKIIPNAREHILSTAKAIVSTQGIDALNMRSVSHGCGIALGTIYNYFPTKADLLVELMASYWDDFFIKVEEYLQEEHDFYTALRCIFNLQSQYVNAFRVEWLVPSFYQTPKGVQKGVILEQRYLQRFTQQIESLISKAHKAGYISPKRSEQDTAQFIQFNLVSLSRQHTISYDLFEDFLRELL